MAAALTTARRFGTTLMLFSVVMPPAAAQPQPPEKKLEHPVGIVLSASDVLVRTVLRKTPIHAAAGMLLFIGDTLINSDNGSIEFVLCADGKKRALRSGNTASIGSTNAEASTELGDSVSFCVLPDVVREPTARQEKDPLPVHERTLEDTLAGLPEQVRRLFEPVESALKHRSDDLTARIAHAVLLEQHKLNAFATDEYNLISSMWSGAEWAHDKAWDTMPPEKGSAVSGPPRTYALLVGVSHYANAGFGLRDLRYAHLDAGAFADFLSTSRGGTLGRKGPDPDLTTKFEQEATRDGLRRNIDDILEKAAPNDTVLLYFATHGIAAEVRIDSQTDQKEVRGFILTSQSNPDDLSPSALSMDDIRDSVIRNLGHVKRVLVYLDVCHAAQVGAIKDVRRIYVMITQILGGIDKLGIFVSSGMGESAYEAPEYGGGHGAFTYFLLRGLNGDADLEPFGDKDGKVNAAELVDYVKSNVGKATWQNQHPDSHNFYLDANEPMTNLNMGPGIDFKPWTRPPQDYFQKSETTSPVQISASRGSPGPSPEPAPTEDLEQAFDQALLSGRLRPDQGDNAFAALDEIRRQTGPLTQARVRALESRLLVALENRGQGALLDYLKGDQEAPKKEKYLDAALDFEAALKLSPAAQFDESRGKFCRGRFLIFEKDYRNAIPLLEEAIRLDPARSYAYNALGIAYLEQVDQNVHYFDYATQAFQDAINRAPYWPYPRHNLALAFTQKGEVQRAAAEYLAAMDIGPYYSYLPYNLGLLYQQIADFPQAKTYYKKAEKIAVYRCTVRMGKKIDSCPERSMPETGLASLEIGQGNRRRARKLLAAALHDDPANLDAAHDQATVLLDSRGHEREAEALWKGNLQRDPGHLPSLIGYSSFLSGQCRFAEALPLYRDTVKQVKEYVPAQIGLARALTATGDLDKAGPLTADLVKQRPTNAEAWAARAEYLSRSGGDSGEAWKEATRLAKDGSQRKQITERAKSGCVSKSQTKH